MIKINPETCAGCQRCCHGTPGDPKINVNRCEHLNRKNNCNLYHCKPIECSIYPIVVFGSDVYVDMACPAWKDAVDQWYEQFGRDVDTYDNNEHKFVKIYLARMIKE